MSAYWLGGRGLVQPVRAVTTFVDGQWCAEQPDTGIWGAGRTEAAAIEDLRRALFGHRDVLMSSTALAPNLTVQRQWLREHLAAS